MGALLLAIRLVLALVLGVAGLAKLADRDGTREAIAGFGAPRALAQPAALLLPIAELATAALLLISASARIGAVLAAALLATFTAAVARSLARGESPDCRCFGQVHSTPVGPLTLARNAVLLAGAIAGIAAGPDTSATAWIASLSAPGRVAVGAAVLLAAVCGAGASLVMRLLRRNGELLLRIEELETAVVPGADTQAAPEFELPALDGERVTLAALRAAGKPVLLTFTDPGCGPCTALLPRLAGWQREHRERIRIAIISRGEPEANIPHAREHGLADVLLQDGQEIDQRFGVSGTPSAVLVAGDGTIASAVHAGAEEIEALVERATATAPLLELHHSPAAIGAQAPDPVLRTLDGEEVPLLTQISEPTVVLFWNPTCGFCERMLEPLRRHDAARPQDAPRLLLVSSGDAEWGRSAGLRAPILLDDSFAAGDAFAAPGTPSGILIDGEGRIASEMAVGAEAVLALAGASDPLLVAA